LRVTAQAEKVVNVQYNDRSVVVDGEEEDARISLALSGRKFRQKEAGAQTVEVSRTRRHTVEAVEDAVKQTTAVLVDFVHVWSRIHENVQVGRWMRHGEGSRNVVHRDV